MTAQAHAQRKQERRAADLARKTAQREQRTKKEGE